MNISLCSEWVKVSCGWGSGKGTCVGVVILRLYRPFFLCLPCSAEICIDICFRPMSAVCCNCAWCVCHWSWDWRRRMLSSPAPWRTQSQQKTQVKRLIDVGVPQSAVNVTGQSAGHHNYFKQKSDLPFISCVAVTLMSPSQPWRSQGKMQVIIIISSRNLIYCSCHVLLWHWMIDVAQSAMKVKTQVIIIISSKSLIYWSCHVSPWPWCSPVSREGHKLKRRSSYFDVRIWFTVHVTCHCADSPRFRFQRRFCHGVHAAPVHASASVYMLKIPNTGSHIVVWTCTKYRTQW